MRPVEVVLRGVAVAVAAIFLLGVTGDIRPMLRRPGRTSSTDGGPRDLHYHAGKSQNAALPDPTCQARGCHGESPHRKNPTVAAFLNMHGSAVECFACHGEDAESHWKGRTAHRDGDRRILYPLPTGKFEPHTLFGTPVTCRRCHSEAGRSRLASRSVAGLPPGFSDPIPLRMIERGGKRWDPADIR